ncbi:MAG TPA: Ldh family oxidoreductase [Stellaceae bacterium]|jgi:(2R)-3-sulfolactate dehydrogenase (NADP+)|nr:Ldh family oxidoreductase [Stellaceae bacterium]
MPEGEARLPAEALHALARQALIAAGTSPANAEAVADALIAAELDGIPSHGLSRLPFYAEQVRSGKVDGRAEPVLSRPAPAVLRVDARSGFAFPAIARGLDAAEAALPETGAMALAIANSHHCGMLGHAVEGCAARGLFALAFANTPAAIAPAGGSRGLFGTNPIAFACPRRAGPPLVIDLSMSVVARGKIMLAAAKGEAIPAGWALDAAGEPTTDAKAALGGTMAPIGGAKGAALALIVELLAAALTRSHFGYEASSFFDAEGPPPRVGQFFLLLDPVPFGGDAVLARVEALLSAMLAEEGVRLPGARRQESRARLARDGIALPAALLRELECRAEADGSAP